MTTENPNYTHGRNVQAKFDFYLLALVFTILGLSIQTATFTRTNYQFEIAAWLLLVISGISGLLRLEEAPNVYITGAMCSDIKHGIQNNLALQKDGHTYTPAEMHASYEILTEILSSQQREQGIMYSIHKWTFIGAVFCLILSRILMKLEFLGVK